MVPTLYDDGGFSGGNTKRPALQRLLDDIDAQRIDIVVVYKVDRLTRSLSDFAKIVDRFDARGVSFVSITQAFNTTSSMGRLTLNVLLSFAQFEREVTGERIRDKIALSKAKGVWMGGVVPLGYDLQDRRLIANPTEATTVRRIFQRYLALQSVNLLREEVEREGIRSKAWTTSGGRQLGGRPLARGALFHILQNRIYVGEIVHKDKFHAALHSPIIDRPTFDAVQEQLRVSRSGHAARKVRAAGAALIGRVFDSERRLMSPSCAYGKKGRLYRYYISLPLQVGERASGVDGVKRVSAEALERYLGDLVGRLAALPRITTDHLATHVRRVDLGAQTTEVVLDSNALFGGRNARFAFAHIQARRGADEVVAWEDRQQTALRVRLPLCLRLRGGRTWIDGRQHAGESSQGNSGLVAALRAAHSGLQAVNASPLTPPEEVRVGPGAADPARAPGQSARVPCARPPGTHPSRRRTEGPETADDLEVGAALGLGGPTRTLRHFAQINSAAVIAPVLRGKPSRKSGPETSGISGPISAETVA
ncbi:hypothetical protein BH11PSE1_BH11PSE1_05180 [soil metagenome]